MRLRIEFSIHGRDGDSGFGGLFKGHTDRRKPPPMGPSPQPLPSNPCPRSAAPDGPPPRRFWGRVRPAKDDGGRLRGPGVGAGGIAEEPLRPLHSVPETLARSHGRPAHPRGGSRRGPSRRARAQSPDAAHGGGAGGRGGPGRGPGPGGSSQEEEGKKGGRDKGRGEEEEKEAEGEDERARGRGRGRGRGGPAGPGSAALQHF